MGMKRRPRPVARQGDYLPELAIAFVGPVGVRTEVFQFAAQERLLAYGYTTKVIRLSGLLQQFADRGYLRTPLKPQPEHDRIESHMDAGDELRQLQTGLLAHAAVADVARLRPTRAGQRAARRPLPARAWLFNSLKHPHEVAVLRAVYRSGFYLVGLFATESERQKALEERGLTRAQARALIQRDLASEHRYASRRARLSSSPMPG